MTPADFASIRHTLGLSQPALARILGIEDFRTISRYERGERKVSGPVSILMMLLDAGIVTPDSLSMIIGERT